MKRVVKTVCAFAMEAKTATKASEKWWRCIATVIGAWNGRAAGEKGSVFRGSEM